MARRYTGQTLKSVTSTSVGVGALRTTAVNGGRISVTGLILGSDAATLGTSNWRFELQRSTTAATGTTASPIALDDADGTALFSSMLSSLTANGTLTSNAILLAVPLSQQATFRWVAAPGEAIVIPLVTNAGLHLMTPVCGNTPSAVAQWYWEE